MTSTTLRKAHPHFAARVKERVSASVDADKLFNAIILAVAKGVEEFAERVKPDPYRNCVWYRIGTPHGIFYVPMDEGGDGALYPKTINDQAMFSRKRETWKKIKTARSRKGFRK